MAPFIIANGSVVRWEELYTGVPEKRRQNTRQAWCSSMPKHNFTFTSIQWQWHADGICAAYWIAFGPHGPRAEAPPGESTKIFTYTVLGVAASLVIFLTTHHLANPPPSTLTKEWEEATNEYFKVRPNQTPAATSTQSRVLTSP